MTTAEKLKALNECRVQLGMKELKAWKESKEKLDLALMTAQRAVGSKAAENVQKLADAVKRKTDALDKTPAKKGEGTSLMQIAKDLGISDKVARAKLRRLGDKVPACVEGHRWAWAGADVEAVKALLGGDRRVK